MGLLDGFKNNKKSAITVPGTKSYKEFPFVDKSFRIRVDECWKNFIKEEAVLRQLIDARADREKISDQIHRLLSPAFTGTYAEVGRKGDKYDLILCLEGDWARLFSRTYFKKKAPMEVFEHWDIFVGRQSDGQAVDRFQIVMGENSVCASDISLWTEWENGYARLFVYCEKMLPLIKGNTDAAYQLLYILLDQAVGELAEMKFFSNIEFIDKPLVRPSISLHELMDDLVSNLSINREQLLDEQWYIDLYSAYHMNPHEDSKDGMRWDIISGSTCFLPMMNAFYGKKTYITDSLEEDGIIGGYLFYPIDNIESDSRGTQLLDLRDAITAELERSLPDSFMFVGGATGVNFGYIDLIAWDIRDVLEKLPEIAEKYGLSWISFREFRQDAEIYSNKS